jgi:hypothetical protein
MSRWFGSVVLSVVLSCSSAWSAHAQASPRAAEPDAATRDAAREHFRLGVELFREGAFAAALAELKRAYALVADHRVHYNIAQTQLALENYVAARASFQRYLDEGGVLIEPRRRREIEAELLELSRRMGTLHIEVAAPSAEIAIDGVVVGQTPLEGGVHVSVGKHSVRARRADGATASETVDVLGGDEKHMRLWPVLPQPTQVVLHGAAQDRRSMSPTLGRRTRWGIGLLGTGVGLGLSAGALWLASRAQQDDYETLQDDPRRHGRARTHKRRADAFVLSAEIAGATGAALTVTSIVLFLTVLTELTSPDDAVSQRADRRRVRSLDVGLGTLQFTQRF